MFFAPNQAKNGSIAHRQPFGGQNNCIIVNFQDGEYMSSAGLRSILSLGKKVKAQGKSLVFCNLQGMVQEVFDVSGFTSIFSAYKSQEEALGAM
ncbi:MAG: STAS domain-containing protein [Thermodesulfobacteriota bacterium]